MNFMYLHVLSYMYSQWTILYYLTSSKKSRSTLQPRSFFFFNFVLKPPMHALMSGKQLEHNTASIIPRQVWNISLYLFVCVCSLILCLATDNSWMMYMYYCDMFSRFFFFAFMIPNHIFFENPSTICTFYLVFKKSFKK